ncbi:hypothetical protein TSAR_012796 [Trichomalopsis sarcophagae]|uniref:Uncharacterized protein n=1 Tax=Trichomalopsis sarcophagae TaxID=543379 RepID=A0A232EXX6_9HYME|nr:hypothetical protein TSAR_012796 [Trichomalopsis sarcophagae]
MLYILFSTTTAVAAATATAVPVFSPLRLICTKRRAASAIGYRSTRAIIMQTTLFIDDRRSRSKFQRRRSIAYRYTHIFIYRVDLSLLFYTEALPDLSRSDCVIALDVADTLLSVCVCVCVCSCGYRQERRDNRALFARDERVTRRVQRFACK